MKRLAVMRAVWLTLVVPTMVLAVVGFYEAFRDPGLLRSPQVEDVMARAGIPIRPVIFVALVLPFVIGTAIAWLIYLRRSRESAAIIFSGVIFFLFTYFMRSFVALEGAHPSLRPVILGVGVISGVAMMFFLFTFPTATFRPRWTIWVFAAILSVLVVLPGTPAALMQMVENRTPQGVFRFSVTAFTVAMIFGIAVQIIRYRILSGPARQQVKWAMLPIVGFGGYAVATMIIPGLLVSLPDEWIGYATVGAIPFGILLPITIGFAVLRHRLYDVDVVINRALVYALLTGLLAGTYIAIVAGASTFAPDSNLAVAAATLAVAALFQPARRRVQGLIDRRFYRRKYDAALTVDHFVTQLRDEVDLDELNAALVRVVDQTMQPTHASVWLRAPESAR